jgi:hypothetical protein
VTRKIVHGRQEHAGQGIEMRDPGEKNRAANGKIPKTAISIRTRYIKTIP